MKESNRTDVQIKISRMIELMSRANGASSKEICTELNCNQRTFYRNLARLQEKDIPVREEYDYAGATNSKRWFIDKEPIQGTQIFLSAEERFFLRMMLERNKTITKKKDTVASILEKLNNGIFHDVDDRNYKLGEGTLSTERAIDDTNMTVFSEAVEDRKSISFSTAAFLFPSDKEAGMVVEETIKLKGSNFVFEPYTIINQSNYLYCIGDFKTEKESIIQCIKISSAKDVKLKQFSFCIPKDYDVDKWNNYFFPTLKTKVHLSMDYFTLQDLKNQEWFLNKKCYNILDQYHLYFETTEIHKLIKLILSYGSGIDVIYPEELNQRVRREHREAMKLQRKIPDGFTQKNEYILSVEALNYFESDSSKAIWQDSLYNCIVENRLDKSILEFDDKKMSTLLKIISPSKDEAHTLCYNEQIAVDIFAENNIQIVPADDVRYLLEEWDSFVDETILKYAPELKDKSDIYKKNGPLFIYTKVNHIADYDTDEILSTGMCSFRTSIVDDSCFIKLPVRAVMFQVEDNAEEKTMLTAYKWRKAE